MNEEELLAAGAAPAVDDRFKQAVLERTGKVVRLRRWVRRAGLAATLAGCYAAGILTMRLWSPHRGSGLDETAQQKVMPAPADHPLDSDPTVHEAASRAVESPLALEWRAVDSLGKRPDLYRQAGDRYLEEAGDVPSALRCYRNLLNYDSQEAGTISPSDSWLLIALKDAKQKEKDRGKNNG